MLRALVLLGLLVNALLWAWGQGWLDRVLGPPTAQTPPEPQRLQRQVRPEIVTVPGSGASAPADAGAAGGVPLAGGSGAPGAAVPALPASAEASAASAPGGPGEVASGAASVPTAGALGASAVAVAGGACLRTGLLTPSERRALRRVAGTVGVDETRWQEEREPPAPRWAVIIGPLEDGAALRRKQDELARLDVRAPIITDAPDLIPGLVLARAADADAAQAALTGLGARGVRTARVVDLSTGAPQVRLRVDGLTPAQAARLKAVPLPAAALANRGVADC